MKNNHIPRDFIQQLLNRIDIVDLIDGRIPLRKKSGSNFFACCPFHSEKSASFSVSQSKQFYHCFGCGAHGNAIDFLMQFDHLSFPESIEQLAKLAGVEVPHAARATEKTISHDPLYELLNAISLYYQKNLRDHSPAIDYLKNRGLTGEIAKTFAIGFALQGWDHLLKQFSVVTKQLFETGMLIKKDDGGFYDRFRERIMFPIHDRRGRIIGFGGRVIDKGEPKYLNSPETPIFQKGHELYGLYHALKAHRELKRVLIVEGYMDVIALFQQGITYTVATLGTATTPHHLQQLFRHTAEIIFCFDGDVAGRTAASRALQITLPMMQDGLQVKFLFLPDGEDPDSLVRKEGKDLFEIRIANALSISAFFFQTINAIADTSSLEGRARFAKLAKDQLTELPDSVFKKMMLDETAKRARIALDNPRENKTFLKSSIKKTRPTSPLKLAMMLLVQHPELANCIKEPLPDLDITGYPLLLDLLALSRSQSLSAASFKESWRDHPEALLIEKLAKLEHMIPEAGIQSEFVGAIKRLKEQSHQQSIEQLLAKANQTGLSQEEKQHLQLLIEKNK